MFESDLENLNDNIFDDEKIQRKLKNK